MNDIYTNTFFGGFNLFEDSFNDNNNSDEESSIVHPIFLNPNFDEEAPLQLHLSESSSIVIRKAHKIDLLASSSAFDNDDDHDDNYHSPEETKCESITTSVSPQKSPSADTLNVVNASTNQLPRASQEIQINSIQTSSQGQIRLEPIIWSQNQDKSPIKKFSKPSIRFQSYVPLSSTVHLFQKKQIKAVNTNNSRLGLATVNKSNPTNQQKFAPRQTMIGNRKVILQPIETSKQNSPVKKPAKAWSTDFRIVRNKPETKLPQSHTKISQTQTRINKQPQVLPLIQLKPCPICLEDINIRSDSYKTLLVCKGVFHDECLKQYILQAIEDRNLPPKCPNEFCNEIILDETIKRLLSEDQIELYEKQKLKVLALENPDAYVHCPTPDCEHIFVKGNTEPEQTCPECSKIICIECREPFHTGLTCAEYKTYQPEDYEIIKNLEEFKWQKCSKCRFWVEKNRGCNHITCICKNQFCFVCGKKWKTCRCVIIEPRPRRILTSDDDFPVAEEGWEGEWYGEGDDDGWFGEGEDDGGVGVEQIGRGNLEEQRGETELQEARERAEEEDVEDHVEREEQKEEEKEEEKKQEEVEELKVDEKEHDEQEKRNVLNQQEVVQKKLAQVILLLAALVSAWRSILQLTQEVAIIQAIAMV